MSAKSQVMQSMINECHLEVRDQRPCRALQVQGREDELVEGAALLVDQVEQLSIVSPGLELASEQAEGGVLVNLDPELEVLAEPHHVGGVAAEPPDHPHPHPGGRGGVGHHIGPCRLEGDAETRDWFKFRALLTRAHGSFVVNYESLAINITSFIFEAGFVVSRPSSIIEDLRIEDEGMTSTRAVIGLSRQIVS